MILFHCVSSLWIWFGGAKWKVAETGVLSAKMLSYRKASYVCRIQNYQSKSLGTLAPKWEINSTLETWQFWNDSSKFWNWDNVDRYREEAARRKICSSNSDRGQRILIFSKIPPWLWGPVRLLLNGCRDSFIGIKRPKHEVDHILPSSDQVHN